MWDQYTWIFGLSFVVAFACAFGIGANDVANSFGTSVGSKALKIWQACIIAAVCEFLGAVLLGAGVTDTIKSNIAKTPLFGATPELLMFGMFCVMCVAAFWDNITCHLELPVSTTHTTVGAVVGMAIALRGFKGVVWSKSSPTFPFVTGMTPIFLSWVISPLLAGICVSILYGLLLRPFVLRSKHSFARALMVVPFLIGLTFFIVVLFIIQTGNKNKTWNPPLTDGKAVWISAIPAGALGILSMVLVVPLLRKTILADEAKALARAQKDMETGPKEEVMIDGKPVMATVTGLNDIDQANAEPENAGWLKRNLGRFQTGRMGNFVNLVGGNKAVRVLTYGSRYDCHSVVQEGHADYDAATVAVWANAEVHDMKTERVFRYLQVFSACVMSFAHGANDVANAMGPFSAVYNIWTNTGIIFSKGKSSSQVPTWILCVGGAGIVVGLGTYGYKIMRVIGVKAVKLSNVRGFSAELSTAIVVMVASRYGLPVSTTQTIMGAVLMLGLFEGMKGVNWKVFLRTFLGWVATLVVAAFLTCGLTSFLLYSPQKTMTDDIRNSSVQMGRSAVAMLAQLRNTPALPAAQWQALNSTLNGVFFLTPNVLSEELATYNRVLNIFAANTNSNIPLGNANGALSFSG